MLRPKDREPNPSPMQASQTWKKRGSKCSRGTRCGTALKQYLPLAFFWKLLENCISQTSSSVFQPFSGKYLQVQAHSSSTSQPRINTCKIKHHCCGPREPFACMHAHETIHVQTIRHKHKSLHGEVHRLFTAC